MIIVEKLDGKTTITKSEEEEKIVSYSMNMHKINLKSLPEYKYNEKDIEESKKRINYIMLYYRNHPESVEKVYNSIISSNDIEETISIFLAEYAENYNSKSKKFDRFSFFAVDYDLLNETLYLSIEEIIKKISGYYFKDIAENMEKEQMIKVIKLLRKGSQPMDFIDKLALPFSEEAIEHGIKDIAAMAFAGEINDAFLRGCKHLCNLNCPVKIEDCPKIMLSHMPIRKYGYIKSGIQEIEEMPDGKRKLKKFLVYDCDLYNEAIQKKLTQ